MRRRGRGRGAKSVDLDPKPPLTPTDGKFGISPKFDTNKSDKLKETILFK